MTQTNIQRAAFSVQEFCERNRICKATYYKLRALGRGPKEMRIGDVVRISATSEREWQSARENPIGGEAAEIAGVVDKRRAIGRLGGKAAAEAPARNSTASRRRGDK